MSQLWRALTHPDPKKKRLSTHDGFTSSRLSDAPAKVPRKVDGISGYRSSTGRCSDWPRSGSNSDERWGKIWENMVPFKYCWGLLRYKSTDSLDINPVVWISAKTLARLQADQDRNTSAYQFAANILWTYNWTWLNHGILYGEPCHGIMCAVTNAERSCWSQGNHWVQIALAFLIHKGSYIPLFPPQTSHDLAIEIVVVRSWITCQVPIVPFI